MKIYNVVTHFVGGWFVGNLEPTVFKTDQFEVSLKHHSAGEVWDQHYHSESVEINYLMRGRMNINGQDLTAPVIFVIDKNEIADPTFYTDVELIVIKAPSAPGDKHVVPRQ